jgi:hypothetical protein
MPNYETCLLRRLTFCDGYAAWHWRGRAYSGSCFCSTMEVQEKHGMRSEQRETLKQLVVAVVHIEEIESQRAFLQRHPIDASSPEDDEYTGLDD